MSEKTKELKMVEVYHNSDLRNFTLDDKAPNVPKELLEKVAIVETTGLDAAFCLTNNIECSWTENVEVTAVKEDLRSTCIGDVLIIDGLPFMVVNNGFKKVNLVDKT